MDDLSYKFHPSTMIAVVATINPRLVKTNTIYDLASEVGTRLENRSQEIID